MGKAARNVIVLDDGKAGWLRVSYFGLSGWFTKAMMSCFRKKNRRPRSRGGETWLQGQKSPQHGERTRKSWDALFEASKNR